MPPRSWSLHPEPVGALPDDVSAPLYAWKNLAAWLDRERPVAEKPALKDAWKGFGRGRPGWRAAAVINPGSGGPNPGSRGLEVQPLGFPAFDGVDTPSASITFRYGEVSFSVPSAWYALYAPGRRWSTPESVLARLWPDFLGAVALSGVDVATLDQNLGCYNLPRNGAGCVFWRDGHGAPHTFFMYVLQMLLVFRDDIQDKESGDGCGWGREYADFLVRLLRREEARRSVEYKADDAVRDTPVVDFRFHFLNPDERFYGPADGVGTTDDSFQYCYSWWEQGVGNWSVAPYQPADPTFEALLDAVSAEAGPPFNHGIRYDAWEWDWQGRTEGYPYLVGRSVFGTAGDRGGLPDPYCRGGAHAGGDPADRVVFHPSWLWYDGLLVDFLLTWARVALDYSDHVGGSPAHEDAAMRLGRFVLRRMVRWGTHVIHEVGHVFCGGSHCEKNNCFMDHLYLRFECAARARLGLYASPLELRATSDACHAEDGHTCSANVTCDFCGSDTMVDGACECTSYQNMVCRIDTGGAPFALGTSYADWFFCMTPCRASSLVRPGESFQGVACSRIQSTTWTTTSTLHDTYTQEWQSCWLDPTTVEVRPGFEFIRPDPDALTVPDRVVEDLRVRPPRVP